jgi:crotonobetainyl-CoA:carnitine CoA-transferase CaiB-like acyl-CoA transferase
LARDKTGAPQHVEASLLGGAMWLGQLNLQFGLFKGYELVAPDHSSDPLTNSYKCKDGRWIFIQASSERVWPQLSAALGIDSLASDPRFVDFEARWANRSELTKIMDETFASRTSAEWAKILAQYRDLIFEIVRPPHEVGSDPQVLENNYVVEMDHPDLGKTKMVSLPLHLNGAPIGKVAPAPTHGQHTEEVLLSLAGCSWEDIERLRDQGVI